MHTEKDPHKTSIASVAYISYIHNLVRSDRASYASHLLWDELGRAGRVTMPDPVAKPAPLCPPRLILFCSNLLIGLVLSQCRTGMLEP